MGATANMSYKYDDEGNECQESYKAKTWMGRLAQRLDILQERRFQWKRYQLLVKQAEAREVSERQWRLATEREKEALEATIEAFKAERHDPHAEALKLLRMVDDILVPVWCRSSGQTEIDWYMLKSWKDDYTQFKLNKK